MGRMGKMGRIYEAEMFLQKAHFLPSLAWVASYIFPILPIFTQLYRTSVKLQGFFKKRHRLLPVCVLKALECFWRATKGHRGRQIPKYIATLNKKAVN